MATHLLRDALLELGYLVLDRLGRRHTPFLILFLPLLADLLFYQLLIPQDLLLNALTRVLLKDAICPITLKLPRYRRLRPANADEVLLFR